MEAERLAAEKAELERLEAERLKRSGSRPSVLKMSDWLRNRPRPRG